MDPLPPALPAAPEQFFDGGEFPATGTPDDDSRSRAEPAAYVIARVFEDTEGESFTLARRIGFEDPEDDAQYLVPRLATWTTDLTSVPAIFTWLVPTTGDHLPAALIHDGLVVGGGDVQEHLGPPVSRDKADRVFRNAMASSGTGLVRRWLIWAAVTLATVWAGQVGERGEGAVWRWYLRAVLVTTGLIIAGLGILAMFDVFDLGQRSRFVGDLPWMRFDSVWADLVGGAAGAIVVPMLLSAAWWRFWGAGAIAGVVSALVVPVAAVIVGLTAAYQAVEWIAKFRRGAALRIVLTLTTLAAAVIVAVGVSR